MDASRGALLTISIYFSIFVDAPCVLFHFILLGASTVGARGGENVLPDFHF